MRLKKWLAVEIAAAAVFLLFSGCSVGTGIESLLLPPKLSEEQSRINKALSDTAGKNISLKYPKSGDYRSPFIIKNLDGEENEEAIAFYEKSGVGGSALRMALLDRKDGQWVSTADHACPGTEVDKVMISDFGQSGETTVVVGYTLINQNYKVLEAYSYQNGTLKIFYTDKYSEMESFDINNDGTNELILISSGVQNTAKSIALNALNPDEASGGIPFAKVLVRNGDSFSEISRVELDTIAIGYTSIVKGSVGVGIPALFIDTLVWSDQIETQILYFENGALSNPLYQKIEVLNATMRPYGYASMDIDGDGIVEIPIPAPFPGYETLSSEEQFFYADWYVFEQYALTKKNSGYLNVNESYCFMLPSRWQGKVTAKQDVSTGETVFYKYSGSLSDSNTELMRIFVGKKGSDDAKKADGYKVLASKGQMEYMVKVPSGESEELLPTQSEILLNFYVF